MGNAQEEGSALSEKGDVEYDWVVDMDGVAGSIERRSQTSDLIVLSLARKAPSKSAGQVPLVADVSIHSRTPVLAMPSVSKTFDPNGIAIIEWNGSPEAAHAVGAAMPLLELASTGKVVSFDEDQISRWQMSGDI